MSQIEYTEAMNNPGMLRKGNVDGVVEQKSCKVQVEETVEVVMQAT